MGHKHQSVAYIMIGFPCYGIVLQAVAVLHN